ncbi:MAG: GMC family oxidoreductase [Anaerolineae bacterium]|jgi:gluconate 2-dehydrogenase alpha chain
MAVQRHVDVVTVGAGWTAAILAWILAEAGLEVVSLEQGPPRWTDPHFAHNHDQLRYTLRQAMMHDISEETWTWRPNPRSPSLPIRQFGSFHPGEGIGGSGIHWAAEYWRFSPTDFAYRTHHIQRYGDDRLPAGTRIRDWPITYAELEPYYARVEADVGISGQAGNIMGERQPGGNPYEGPRSGPYPLPPSVRSIPATMFSEVCQSLGYHPFPQAAAILSRAYTGLSGVPRAGCLYCGFCTRYGCEVDAKASPISEHIPMAQRTGRYEIRTFSKVLGISVADNGLATGVSYVDRITGERHEQPASIVILSAYTLSNVRLLLLSRSSAHPNGVGNDRGLVGTNLTYQLVRSPVAGIFQGRRFNLFMGNACLQDVIHDFNGDNFDHTELDFIGGASISCGGGERSPLVSTLGMPAITAGQEPAQGANGGGARARTHPAVAGEVSSLAGSGTEWGQDWKENLRRNWDAVVSIGIQGESLPYDDQFMDLDPAYRDSFGLPLLRLTYDFHQNDYNLYRFVAARCQEIMERMGPTRMVTSPELEPYNVYSYQSTHITGGAIMGTSPGDSVTNRYGQVWDTPNVFVTGAALYPQNPGMNPTGTLLALAYLAGDAIRLLYLRDPGRVIAG